MRIKNLLIHRATLLIPGEKTGEDSYGRPIYSAPSTKQVDCRLDQIQTRVSTDEEGRDVLLSYFLYLGPNEKVDAETRVTNVIDEQGNVVVYGTFNIENIHPVYRMRSLHHYEINLSRGDVNYA